MSKQTSRCSKCGKIYNHYGNSDHNCWSITVSSASKPIPFDYIFWWVMFMGLSILVGSLAILGGVIP
jgi:hypothetical protein